MPSTTRKYGEIPWYQKLGVMAAMLPMPAILAWTALVTWHTAHNKKRSLKRVIGEQTLRYTLGTLNFAQCQYAFGNSFDNYQKWTKEVGLAPVVDELGDGARLLWIGPKRLDRVLFGLHGGCFILPLTDFTLAFWRYVQETLKGKGIEVGVAMLEYSLAPMDTFPTPLQQATLGLQALILAGVRPENIFVAGDSAGGNLALQLMSQILHPRESVPRLQLDGRLGGVCLLSPWACFTTEAKSYTEFTEIDTMSKTVLHEAGAVILGGFSNLHADRSFGEPTKAPSSWFKGIDSVVGRILVTAGEWESMRDDILRVAELLKEHHTQVELIVQDGGLHDDPLIDFFAKETKLGSLTPKVISWFADSQ